MGIIERARLWIDRGTYKEPIDSDNIRVPRLEVDDASTFIDKDGSNNMTLTDAVTGTKTLAQLSGTGDVTGPGSSTDNAIARFHETTGKIIQDSGCTIDDSGNLLPGGHIYQKQDAAIHALGISYDFQIRYLPADADAKHALFLIDESADSGNNVPVFAFAEHTGAEADLGLFDAFVQPMVCVVDNDKDSYFGITFSADDTPQLIAGGAVNISLALPTSGTLISGDLFDADTFLYASSDNTPVATSPANVMAALSGHAAAAFDFNAQNLTGVPIIYGASSTYLRIGDAVTTAHSLDSEDDLMVTGQLEVKGDLFLDASFRVGDGIPLYMGSSYDLIMLWDTHDANSNMVHLIKYSAGGGNDVPFWVFGDASLADLDVGLFDGTEQPTIAVIEKDAKYASASDATSSGADTTLTVDGSEFTNAVVGDILRVTAGTNATAGWYWITTVTDANNVVLDRNWCSGVVSGGTFVTYHDFTMLSADGICTRITDGAPTDASIEIDRDGWIIMDVGNNLLYGRSQATWHHWTPDGGSPSFAGLTLTGALDANSQAINSVAAPSAAGDPLIKGTRVTTAELPAMTDEKIWKGTGTNVEEITVPPRTVCKVVATSDATADEKAGADYTLSGADDEVDIETALALGNVKVVGATITPAATIDIPASKCLELAPNCKITSSGDFNKVHVGNGAEFCGGIIDVRGDVFNSAAIIIDGADAYDYPYNARNYWGAKVHDVLLMGDAGAADGDGILLISDANDEKIMSVSMWNIHISQFTYGMRFYTAKDTTGYITECNFNNIHLAHQQYPLYINGCNATTALCGIHILGLEIQCSATTDCVIMCRGIGNVIIGTVFDAQSTGATDKVIDFYRPDPALYCWGNKIILSAPSLDYIADEANRLTGAANNWVEDPYNKRLIARLWKTQGYTLERAIAVDHSYSGIADTGTAGEDLVFPDAVYMKSDGKYGKSDADAASTMPVMAICSTTIANDASGLFILPGSYIRDDTWDWTIGSIIYASCTAGGLTQTKPSGSGDQVQAVGVAITADVMFFDPIFTNELLTGLTGVIRADAGVPSVDSDVTDLVTAATLTAAGKVELATGAETNTGTDATRAVTPDGLDDWTGSAQIVTVGTLSAGDVTAQVSAASTTAQGKIEVATAAETTTGTDATRAVSPDGLAGSLFGKKTVSIKVFDDATAVATGDGKFHFFCPETLNGMNLVGVSAGVSTVSSSGLPTVQIHNLTHTADMLSTLLTIDANEKHSKDATAAAVINAAEDDVVTGDELRIDVDIAGTGTKGLQVDLIFQLP